MASLTLLSETDVACLDKKNKKWNEKSGDDLFGLS